MTPAEKPIQQETPNRRGAQRLLLIEEQPLWREMLHLELPLHLPGWELTDLSDGDGLPDQLLAGEKYDAILIDGQTGALDDWQLVHRLRGVLYAGPILIWASYQDVEEWLTVIADLPVDGIFVKENDMSELACLLRQLEPSGGAEDRLGLPGFGRQQIQVKQAS